MPEQGPTNDQIADVLDQIAGLLEVQEANRFRLNKTDDWVVRY